jgi:Zn-dependent protease
MSFFSYRVATVMGIPIKLHVSLLLLVILLWIVASNYGGAKIAALLLAMEAGGLMSILLHELGHSLVARLHHCRVHEITLTLIGGMAHMDRMPDKPSGEIAMALAGPAVSLVLGASFYSIAGLLPAGSASISVYLLNTLGLINFVLAGFNLLPSFPMDGGRVFRALLQRRMGRLNATRIATRIGRLIALMFILQGLFAQPGSLILKLIPVRLPDILVMILQSTNFILTFAGIFLFISAGREYRAVQAEEYRRRQARPAFWPWMQEPPEEPADRVHISPSPYTKGKPEESDLYEERAPRPPF